MHLPQLTRRELLRRSGMGLGMMGLAGILAGQGSPPGSARADQQYRNPLAPKAPVEKFPDRRAKEPKRAKKKRTSRS